MQPHYNDSKKQSLCHTVISVVAQGGCFVAMKDVDTKKYIVYTRKSSEDEDRQVLSNESQIRELQGVISRDKSQVMEILQESMSAKKPGRPIFSSMVQKIEKGEANSIVVWHPDRLSRNSIDSGKLIYLMDTEILKEIKTPHQVFQNTPNDKFMLSILWGTAKLDNDNKGINVRRGLKDKLVLGWYPFVAPHGYLNTPDRGKGYKIIIEDKERFHLVRKMWDLLLTGNYTVPDIVRIADEEWGYKTLKRKKIGGTPISRSGMYDLFTNPFYYGEFNVKGIWWKGVHKPMILKAEFLKAQAIIGRVNKQRPQKHESPYTGFITCPECGCSITFTHKEKYYRKTNNHEIYEYLHCTRKKLKEHECHQKPLKVSDAEKQIVETLSNLYLQEDFRKWALDYLKKTNQIEITDRMQIFKNLSEKKEAINRNLSKLLDLLLEEKVDESSYKLKKEQLEGDLARVDEEFLGLDDRGDKWIGCVEEAFDIATVAVEKFNNGTPEDKRFILNKIGENFRLKDRELLYDLKKPYFVFKDANEGKYKKYERLEPVEMLDNITKMGIPVPENLSWLPIVDSNLLLFVKFLLEIYNNTLVGDPGIEPGTSSLSEKRSNQLS